MMIATHIQSQDVTARSVESVQQRMVPESGNEKHLFYTCEVFRHQLIQ